MAPTSPDVAPTRADFLLKYHLECFNFTSVYQNGTQESRTFQVKYQEIIIMPSIYVYGRLVGISRGFVGIGRSQVGADRYESGLSLHKSGLDLHKSGLIVTSRC